MVGRRSMALGFVVALVVMAGPAAGAALADPQIYWGNLGSGTIGAADLDGSNPNQSFMTGLGNSGKELFAVAVDGRHIYWGNYAEGTIGVGDFDGTVVNASLISGVQGIDAIAVNSHHIYWVNALTNTIGEANLDGSDVNANFISVSGEPFALAVNGQHLYWTNTSTNAIGEANLDGTGVNQNLITGADGITGLTLDGHYLYWANYTSETIGRANLDGTGADESFITGAYHAVAVSVDGQEILWSNQSASGTIGAAPIGGGSGQLGFITGAYYPLSLAVSVPVAELSPGPPPAFAGTQLGSISAATTLTVTNTGQAPLTFTGQSLALTGADPGDFAIGADGCVGSVAPGGSCQLEVYFSPQDVGVRSATLQLASNDYANGPLEVSLSGVGTTVPVALSAPAGSTPPAGPATSSPTSQPGATVELVICKTGTKTVSRKVGGKRRNVRVKQQKCSRRLVSAGVGALIGSGHRATISRGGVKYATGTALQFAGGRSQLILTELRPVPSGNYTLTLQQGRRGQRTSTITLR